MSKPFVRINAGYFGQQTMSSPAMQAELLKLARPLAAALDGRTEVVEAASRHAQGGSRLRVRVYSNVSPSEEAEQGTVLKTAKGVYSIAQKRGRR